MNEMELKLVPVEDICIRWTDIPQWRLFSLLYSKCLLNERGGYKKIINVNTRKTEPFFC